jgi:hypothetical protein
VCDNLFSQFRTATGSTYTADTEISDFLASIVANTGADAFKFGGLTFGEGLAPADDAGINMIGITMVIHYSRSDF